LEGVDIPAICRHNNPERLRVLASDHFIRGFRSIQE